MLPHRSLFLRVALFIMTCPLVVCAQQTQPSAPKPGYTLQTGTSLVLTDVTVTDKNGKPVQSLERSAFHVFDNGKPQQIASFAEHTSGEIEAQPPVVHQVGEVSNDYLQHPPPALDVLLLDITTIAITDQMFLAQQLEKFVSTMAPNDLFAVYTRAGDHVVLLQDFTSDRAELLAAVRKAIPRLQQPGSWAASDLDTLQQMVRFLRPYPGRKNLIWFSGGSNMALMVDASVLPAPVDMRPLYDALEATRIAVYPVDARGLSPTEWAAMVWQQMLMSETAEATGGHAYFNNNGLKEITAHILHDGDDFYTLTYAPRDHKLDKRWHKVTVAVDGPYQLSYRRGYFDDASHDPDATRNGTQPAQPGKAQKPDVLKPAILFSATVLPLSVLPAGAAASPSGALAAPSPTKRQTTYNVHFTLPAAAFALQHSNGQSQFLVGTGILGVNRLGAHVARKVLGVQVTVDPEKLQSHPNGTVGVDEQVDLPQGDLFLYVMVWDQASGRFGMVQTPVNVAKASR